MASAGLLRRKGTLAAELLAVSLGAALLYSLSDIAFGLPARMRAEFRSYGANLVLLPAQGEPVFTKESLDAARSLLPEKALLGLCPYRFHAIKVNEQPIMAAGTDFEQMRKTSPWHLVHGRYPENIGEALAGAKAAKETALTAGRVFRIKDREYTVSGLLETGGEEENYIYFTTDGFEQIAGEGGVYDSAECSLSLSAGELNSIAEKINAEISGIQARPVRRLVSSENSVLGKLRALMFLTLSIALPLIMICTGTTMLSVVSERRSEIALRKSLGASGQRLLREFLFEALLTGIAGGLAGSAAGFAAASFIGGRVFSAPPAFNAAIFALTVFITLLVTLASEAIPVRKASALDPALVLRGE